jgi:hypothetical protein
MRTSLATTVTRMRSQMMKYVILLQRIFARKLTSPQNDGTKPKQEAAECKQS